VAPQQALEHPWLIGETATDHNLLPEIKRFMARARLRRGVELVKLANRIEQLKMRDDDPDKTDLPDDPMVAADNSGHPFRMGAKSPGISVTSAGSSNNGSGAGGEGKRKLSKAIKGAIFREVVLAKVREMKQSEETLKVAEEVEREARRRSFHETK
jgi:calcium/calmodulin-dependent protein kinase I